MENLNLAEIMPATDHYMTYEGSTTYPGCWETVTWIVMNKPIYISRQEMYALKQLMQGDRINPKSPLAPNSRPIQENHSRGIRTNVYYPETKLETSGVIRSILCLDYTDNCLLGINKPENDSEQQLHDKKVR